MIPELNYLTQLIGYRLNAYFQGNGDNNIPVFGPVCDWHLPVRNFIATHKLNESEATLLLIALAAHLQPGLFEQTIRLNLPDANIDFPHIGGTRGKNSRYFLPTGETALFLLSDGSLEQRLSVQKIFGAEHIFNRKRILWLEEVPDGEPQMSGRLIVSQDYIDTFLLGKPTAPHFSAAFPARKIEEKRDWDSLVTSQDMDLQIGDLRTWLKHNNELKQYGVSHILPRGYRALFCGPPGTGKTLTAGLLGKEMGRDVYKVDLSMVVSKYIGETEKNLELLFSRAEDKEWILFFDEADALFGKRTNVRDAHDKYANQEVSYLLQRMENFEGLVILATNMKNNLDEAFMRRFNSVLKFPFPEPEERRLIWSKSFPVRSVFKAGNFSHGREIRADYDVLNEIKKYELAGGNIINVVHYSCLKALEKRGTAATLKTHLKQKEAMPELTIYVADIMEGIQKELNKLGRPFA